MKNDTIFESDDDDISDLPADFLAAANEGMAQARAEIGLGTSPAFPIPFAVDSEARAEWLLRKLATIDAEAERMKANTCERLRELQTDRDRLLHRFGEQFMAWARGEAATRRRKTVTLANGAVTFRATPARFAITNEDAAIEAARTACPAALAVATVTRLDRNALLGYVEATGEVLPGVEWIPAGESVSIKPGGAKKGEEAPG